MNDEQLDQELRQLFEADTLTVDPTAPASAELLEEISSENPALDLISVPRPETVDGDVFGATEADRSPKRTALLLVAAVLLFAALIGIARFVLPSNDEAPLISDDFDVNGAEEIVPDGFIVGPIEPEVLILHPQAESLNDNFVDADEIAGCVRPSGDAAEFMEGATPAQVAQFEFESLVFSSGGRPILGEVSSTHGERAGFEFSALTDVTGHVSCFLAGDGANISETDRRELFENGPLEIEVASSPSFSFDSAAQIAERVVVVIGKHDGTVVDVRIPELSDEQQVLKFFGQNWFVLEYDSEVHLRADIELSTGEVLDEQLASGSFRSGSTGSNANDCFDRVCLQEELAEDFAQLEAEAREAGAERQAAFLSSGVLSQAEYDAAEASFIECIETEGMAFEPALFLEAGTAEGDLAVSCYETEIIFVERGRLLQNSTVDAAALIDEIFERDIDELDVETDDNDDATDKVEADPAMLGEARRLFGGGLSREELEELWDGYPYLQDERDDRIEAYLDDFAWMRDGITVEVNLFEQFEGTGNFVPIVTAQSVQDRSLNASFVLGGQAGDLTIRRLPEASTELPNIYDDGESLVLDGVGVEGQVRAFVEGGELATESDGFITTIERPSSFTPNSLLTIVFPTPEEPAAFSLPVSEIPDQ